MCLIVCAWQAHAAYPLIVGANRDEFYDRPSEGAHHWPLHPEVLAGRDLKAGGTWLGVTRAGRFAAVTNFRDPLDTRAAPRSRGALTLEFLIGSMPAGVYAAQVSAARHDYSGFNLLLGDGEELWYVGSRAGMPQRLVAGIYGLSNHVLDTPWPKVVASKARFVEAVSSLDPETGVFDLLGDRSHAADESLPDTGVGFQWERALSPAFIVTERYGTRASTFLAQAGSRLRFVERNYAASATLIDERRFES
jgi:uncharacterized protein with NRDE domain